MTPPLKAAGKALLKAVLAEYAFSGAERAVLEQAAMAADRVAEARAQIDAEGSVVTGRAGPRVHPSVLIERDARASLLRALKDLGVVDRREPTPRDSHTPGPKPRRRA